MGTLSNDIRSHSEWIVKALNSERFKLDYSIRSFLDIYRFFKKHAKDGKPVRGGRLSNNLGSIIFSIGAYIGETIIQSFPGAEWQIDETDPEAEINVAIKLKDGCLIWPVQRVMERFQNGM